MEEFELDIPENSKLKDVLKLLGIPEKEIILVVNPGPKEKVLTIINGFADRNTITLKGNDKVFLYPFLPGG